MLYTITDGVQNGPSVGTDALGEPIVHNTRCMATPNGPVAMGYGEIIDAFTTYPKMFLPITLARLRSICDTLKQPTQPPVDVDEQAIAHAVAVELASDPSNPLTEDDIPAIAETVVGAFAKHLSRTPDA